MEWRELGNGRVLVVSLSELQSEFELIRESPQASAWQLARRRRDGKLFREARWQPLGAAGSYICGLEEA